MQVTETVSDGLRREFDVKVPAADLEARVFERLGELKDRVRINGFRPGKVPVAHLKKIYGRAVMAETIEAVIREMNAKIVDERGLKLAMEPKVTIPDEAIEVERVIGGKTDLAYKLAFEVLPKIEIADFSQIKLERLVADVALEQQVRDLEQQSIRWQSDATHWRDVCAELDRRHADDVGKVSEGARLREELEARLTHAEQKCTFWERDSASLRGNLAATQRILRPYSLIDQLGVVTIGYRWARRLKPNRAS